MSQKVITADQLTDMDEVVVSHNGIPTWTKVLKVDVAKDGNVYVTVTDPRTGGAHTFPVPHKNKINIKDNTPTGGLAHPGGNGNPWIPVRMKATASDPEPDCTCDIKQLFSSGCTCDYVRWKRRREKCS